MRAWLYRIATNACLDALRKSQRQVDSLDSLADLPWLQPFPDRLLANDDPGAAVVAKETIELAYIAVIQLLPARRRAVLILRDVLGWSAAEAASALEMSVPSVNSALQRARTTIGGLAPARDDAAVRTWQPSAWERQLLDGYREIGDRYYEADTLAHLGDAYDTAGRSDLAHEAWKEALTILDQLGHNDAAAVRQRLVSRSATEG